MGLAHLRLIDVERQRRPGFGAARILKPGWHDPNDGVLRAVEIYPLPHYVWVAAETPLPQPVAEQSDFIMIRSVLLGGEDPPPQRSHAEDGEEIVGNESSYNCIGQILARQRLLPLSPRRDPDQRPALPLPVEEIRGSDF